MNLTTSLNLENPKIKEKTKKPENEKQLKKIEMTFATQLESKELISKQNDELLLKENPRRYVLFPIKYRDIYNFYNCAKFSYWLPEEVSKLSEDIKHWNSKMTPDEKHFIEHILAFFAASDGIVNENLTQNFSNEVQIPEARNFYDIQIAMEGIHNESYSLIIDTYIGSDEVKKEELLNAVENFPAIKKKAEWAKSWINRERSFAERLIAFAIVEGLFFSGSFCAVFWLKIRGILPGLVTFNELISRDEGLHLLFACLLFVKYIKNKPTQRLVEEIMKQAVSDEKEFIIESLPCKLIGMNSELMSKYIEYVADYIMINLGYKKIYNTPCPFPWMEMISMQRKTNFFEGNVSEYSKKKFFHIYEQLLKEKMAYTNDSTRIALLKPGQFSTNFN